MWYKAKYSARVMWQKKKKKKIESVKIYANTNVKYVWFIYEIWFVYQSRDLAYKLWYYRIWDATKASRLANSTLTQRDKWNQHEEKKKILICYPEPKLSIIFQFVIFTSLLLYSQAELHTVLIPIQIPYLLYWNNWKLALHCYSEVEKFFSRSWFSEFSPILYNVFLEN